MNFKEIHKDSLTNQRVTESGMECPASVTFYCYQKGKSMLKIINAIRITKKP